MFSKSLCSIVLMATLSSSAPGADLPPAPSIALPEGLEWVVVVRTAKLRETMTGYGLSWDTFGKSAFRKAFNPFSGIPDDAVRSLVVASSGSSKTEYSGEFRWIPFLRPHGVFLAGIGDKIDGFCQRNASANSFI